MPTISRKRKRRPIETNPGALTDAKRSFLLTGFHFIGPHPYGERREYRVPGIAAPIVDWHVRLSEAIRDAMQDRDDLQTAYVERYGSGQSCSEYLAGDDDARDWRGTLWRERSVPHRSSALAGKQRRKRPQQIPARKESRDAKPNMKTIQ